MLTKHKFFVKGLLLNVCCSLLHCFQLDDILSFSRLILSLMCCEREPITTKCYRKRGERGRRNVSRNVGVMYSRSSMYLLSWYTGHHALAICAGTCYYDILRRLPWISQVSEASEKNLPINVILSLFIEDLDTSTNTTWQPYFYGNHGQSLHRNVRMILCFRGLCYVV